MLKHLSLLLGVVLLFGHYATALRGPLVEKPLRKKLAGPPEEFANHMPPVPQAGGVWSNHALLPFSFDLVNGQQEAVWEQELPVDSIKSLTFTVFSPIEEDLHITLKSPSSQSYIPIFKLVKNVERETSYGYLNNVPSTTYVMDNVEAGLWSVRVSTDGKALIQSKRLGMVMGYFQMVTDGEEKAFTTVRDYRQQTTGSKIVMESIVSSTDRSEMLQAGSMASVALPIVTSATMDIKRPDGSVLASMQMRDDGVGADMNANDGIFTADFAGAEPGVYRTICVIRGQNRHGKPFIRTTHNLISVVHDTVELTGSGWIEEDEEEPQSFSQIMIEAEVEKPFSSSDFENHFRLYAQVWGSSMTDGSMVPVAWIGGMAHLEEKQGKLAFNLEISHDWLARAQASFPLELREVSVEEPSDFIVVAAKSRILLSAPSNLVLSSVLTRSAPAEITSQMREGRKPKSLQVDPNVLKADSGKLMLVHGYCSDAPGPFTQKDFENFVVFSSWNSNDPVDVFARKIQAFGEKFSSFGIMAHSQGGQASLQLHTHYWSPLENAVASPKNPGVKRLINSVGTPYHGCTLAGGLASIGDLFGVGCGHNKDLTHDGSNRWLKGIPMKPREDVYFYTTTYSTSGIFHYCSMAANGVLSWPNDGVTELKYAKLEGANGMDNKKGWCHVEHMKHHPQGTDPERNAHVNALAAR